MELITTMPIQSLHIFICFLVSQKRLIVLKSEREMKYLLIQNNFDEIFQLAGYSKLIDGPVFLKQVRTCS